MISTLYKTLLLIGLLVAAAGAGYSQDQVDIFGKPLNGKEKDAPPRGIQETMDKMRIAQDKKEFAAMMGRSEEVLKIAEDLERAFDQRSTLTPTELEKLDSVEKMVKKIRTELGGEDDDGDDPVTDAASAVEQPRNLSPGVAIKFLRDSATKLYAELKKTTRFTVSIVAIQVSNNVLKLTRFLKLTH